MLPYLLNIIIFLNWGLDANPHKPMIETSYTNDVFAGRQVGGFFDSMAYSILDYNAQRNASRQPSLNLSQAVNSGGLSFSGNFNSNFQGPVLPGQTIGGVNPLTATKSKGSVLGAQTGPTSTLTGTGFNQTGPQPGDIFGAAKNAASSENDALLSSLNTEFDRTAANLQGQLGYLGQQKDETLGAYDTQLEGVKKQVGSSKENTQRTTQNNVQDALSSAQEVERKNRNMLRGLGILNSSAAGDVLSRGYGEYDKQRARLVEASTQRINELDDFLDQKVAEHSDAVKSVLRQFNQLTSQIQQDLRFNDRQRADAIKSANAALQQRFSEIQSSVFNFAQQVNAQKQTLGTQLKQLAGYQDPTANLGAIQGQVLSGQQAQNPMSVGITQEDPQKKLLASLGLN